MTENSTSSAGRPSHGWTTSSCAVVDPQPISAETWRICNRPCGVISICTIAASAPVPKSFCTAAKPTPYSVPGLAASYSALRAARFVHRGSFSASARISSMRK